MKTFLGNNITYLEILHNIMSLDHYQKQVDLFQGFVYDFDRI
jgi:hypothetical protein